MNRSFYTGVIGAKSYQSGINNTGGNISNINTVGHRRSIIEFSDLFSKHLSRASRTTSDDLGHGSKISTTKIDLKEGPIKSTENTFDLAIRGKGWFGVKHKNIYDNRERAYTRAGVFYPNKDRHLVDPNGNYLLGTYYNNIKKVGEKYMIDKDIAIPKPDIKNQSKLFVPKNITTPNAITTKVDLNINLKGENKRYSPANKKKFFKLSL